MAHMLKCHPAVADHTHTIKETFSFFLFFYFTSTPVPSKDVVGQTFEGTGSDVKDERKDLTDKADPIREHDCIWCMACVSVCPPQAIKVDQANVEAHETAAKTL